VRSTPYPAAATVCRTLLLLRCTGTLLPQSDITTTTVLSLALSLSLWRCACPSMDAVPAFWHHANPSETVSLGILEPQKSRITMSFSADADANCNRC
jgi:hypothetical protein